MKVPVKVRVNGALRETEVEPRLLLVQFLRDVKGDDDLADEFEGMDLGEYADHKGITIRQSRKKESENAKRKRRPADQG